MSIAARSPCRYGLHRVLDPCGVMPQAAWRLDATPRALENEILCDVEALNIDSASFRQIAEACDFDEARIAAQIVATVGERGKQHNPVTGSGGMFIGRVAEIGSAIAHSVDLRAGDRIASLVSLTLTPLSIAAVRRVDCATGRIWIEGKAILFASGLFAKLPDDLDEGVALAVFDVAGAPAQTRRLAQPGATVAIFGVDGKSGMLCCAQARGRVGPAGRIVGFAPDATTAAARLLVDGGYVDAFVEIDARDAAAVLGALPGVLPAGADLVINCVNVPGTELAAILAAKDHGTVYFFSMCTSFTAAALGAEGIGRDCTMIIGDGYLRGHAATALETLRAHPSIRAHFESRYGSAATTTLTT